MSHSQSVSSRNRKAVMIMHVNINIILTVMFSTPCIFSFLSFGLVLLVFFFFTLTAYHYYSGVTLNSVHFIMKLLVSFLFRLLCSALVFAITTFYNHNFVYIFHIFCHSVAIIILVVSI